VLREERFDFSSEQGLEGYEGALTYLVPISHEIDLRHSGSEEAKVLSRAQTEHVARRFRWHREWGESYESTDVTRVSRSGSVAATYAVYRDGILLSTGSPPPFHPLREPLLPLPRIVVNLPKSRAPRVDLGRTQLVGQAQHWASPILQAHARHVSEAALEGLLALDPSERLYHLARLVAFDKIEADHLWQIFPRGRWPVPFLEAGGRLTVLELQQVPSRAIYLNPQPLADELAEMGYCRWVAQEEYTGPLLQWDGQPCVVAKLLGGRRLSGRRLSGSISKIQDMWQLPFQESHCFGAVRFLQPPWKGNPPLIQAIWLPVQGFEEPGDSDSLLRKTVDAPTLLNLVEKELLHRILSRYLLPRRRWLLPRLAEFPPPFEQSFAYGSDWWNLKHSVPQAVLRCLAALLLSTMQRTLPQAQIGILQDHLQAVFEGAQGLWWGLDPEVACKTICDSLHHALSLAHEIHLFDPGKIGDLMLTPGDFVPGSHHEWELGVRELRETATGRPFGKPLV